ncbi:MAG: GIY-YIG nuclease family protein [Caldilineaceae bacterium]|nr:GIY-YIG nuclease family protein [Caldilineaceae bacterium]
MTKPIEEILAPKPEARPRIYAYAIDDAAHAGLLKVGQTTRNVQQRVAEQLKTAAIKNYRIEVDEAATRDDGTLFSDHEVRAALAHKGFERVALEWMRCTVADVKTVLTELRTGQPVSGARHATFPMRHEQAAAVHKTHAYFHSIWQEDMHATPRFLWNAKMRFGKTFAAYQLAKKLGAKRVLVVTFKPAVEDAWQTDLESHVDFDGWQYLSRASASDPTQIDRRKPVVYFGSFQDLLGRDGAGNIKPKNEWIHTIHWDLVIFDEYHFGAWRETAKELFEGEEAAVALRETRREYAAGLAEVNEDLSELAAEFLPITTNAYLYLSGTPFRALATSEFIEEQIFNWTYTDEQRARAEFAAQHPDRPNPYAALPQMRLLTYQLSGRLPGAVALGHPEPPRRQPPRGGDSQARLLRLRLCAHPRPAPAFGIRHRPLAQRAEPGECGAGSGLLPARAGLRRRQYDADRRGRYSGYRDGRHLRHAAGAQVGERAAGECGQRDPAPHPGQPGGPGRGRAHRGLARPGRQHHRDHHQQK